MVQSYNRLSSSMSAVFGAHGSGVRQQGRAPVKGPGAVGPSGTGRGTIKGKGAGRGTGKRPVRGLGRTHSSGVNTPLINPKGTPNKSRSVDNNTAKVKRKKQKQKKVGNTGEVSRSNYIKRLSIMH